MTQWLQSFPVDVILVFVSGRSNWEPLTEWLILRYLVTKIVTTRSVGLKMFDPNHSPVSPY